MSERDDIIEQAFHTGVPTRADIQRDAEASAMVGLPARLSYNNSAIVLPEYSTRMQQQVAEFTARMGGYVSAIPASLPAHRVSINIELIREEFEDELIPALHAGDLIETADACVDLLYVVFGLMVSCGLDAGPLFEEVHRSNMTKLGADGKPIIAGLNDPDGIFPGRVKKGPYYSRPDLGAIINREATS